MVGINGGCGWVMLVGDEVWHWCVWVGGSG